MKIFRGRMLRNIFITNVSANWIISQPICRWWIVTTNSWLTWTFPILPSREHWPGMWPTWLWLWSMCIWSWCWWYCFWVCCWPTLSPSLSGWSRIALPGWAWDRRMRWSSMSEVMRSGDWWKSIITWCRNWNGVRDYWHNPNVSLPGVKWPSRLPMRSKILWLPWSSMFSTCNAPFRKERTILKWWTGSRICSLNRSIHYQP